MNMEINTHSQNDNQGLLFDLPSIKSKAYNKRNDPMFLRNQFPGMGKFGICKIKKQEINLDNIGLIACTNTKKNDKEYFDFGVHFFVDDYNFEEIYANPEKSYPKYSQYEFCLTPDFSAYNEMPIFRQIESVSHSRWCGAWWQSKGMKVIPTISWGQYNSFEFCFEGIERESIVAVATYACSHNKTGFLRGYDAMLERISPSAIICYGKPFPHMRGNIKEIKVCHPRQFHREI